MPTSREVVVNRALSGAEVRAILEADVAKLLDSEGLLSPYVAYGRFGYYVEVRLFTGNPMTPESSSFVESRGGARPEADDVVSAGRISRHITSPNAERLRAGLPVTVESLQQDGTKASEQIHYPPQEDLGEGEVELSDTTAAARAKWGLVELISAAQEGRTPPNEHVQMGKCGHSAIHVTLSGICSQCQQEWAPMDGSEPEPVEPGEWPTGQPDKVDAFFGGDRRAVQPLPEAKVQAAD